MTDSPQRVEQDRRTRLARLGPGDALLPLRLFLGLTFVYAGVQKLSDPGFLHPGAPTYIGTQLQGFARGTPGGFILHLLALPHPALAGVGVALFEICVGLLVVSGLLTRPAAVAGLALSALFFLTASWHTYPYFLGADIVFVFAWLPFVLVGAAGQPALDHLLAQRARSARVGRRPPASAGRRARELVPGAEDAAVSRRALLARSLGFVGAASLGIGGIASLAKGSYRGKARVGARVPAAAPARPTHTTARKAPSSRRTGVPANAVRLGDSRQLRPGTAGTYTDPADGQPDLLIRQPDGTVTAMSAICTHAGCEVGYQNGQVACPCHGALFNAKTGAVEGGPAPQGLALRHVVEHDGSIYALRS